MLSAYAIYAPFVIRSENSKSLPPYILCIQSASAIIESWDVIMQITPHIIWFCQASCAEMPTRVTSTELTLSHARKTKNTAAFIYSAITLSITKVLHQQPTSSLFLVIFKLPTLSNGCFNFLQSFSSFIVFIAKPMLRPKSHNASIKTNVPKLSQNNI